MRSLWENQLFISILICNNDIVVITNAYFIYYFILFIILSYLLQIVGEHNACIFHVHTYPVHKQFWIRHCTNFVWFAGRQVNPEFTLELEFSKMLFYHVTCYPGVTQDLQVIRGLRFVSKIRHKCVMTMFDFSDHSWVSWGSFKQWLVYHVAQQAWYTV